MTLPMTTGVEVITGLAATTGELIGRATVVMPEAGTTTPLGAITGAPAKTGTFSVLSPNKPRRTGTVPITAGCVTTTGCATNAGRATTTGCCTTAGVNAEPGMNEIDVPPCETGGAKKLVTT